MITKLISKNEYSRIGFDVGSPKSVTKNEYSRITFAIASPKYVIFFALIANLLVNSYT